MSQSVSQAARLRAARGVEHDVLNEQLKDGGDVEREAMLDRFVAAWNPHDLDRIMASITDDCASWSSSSAHPRGGFEGREALAEALTAIFRSFPTRRGPKAGSPPRLPAPCGDGGRRNDRGWKTTRLLRVDILVVVEARIQQKISGRQ